MAEEVREQWVMKFDGSFTTQSRVSFKLEFSCSNNTAEYEAYLTRLATTLEMGINYLRVIGDSNLVACQTKGSFSLKEPSLIPYRAMA